MYKNDINEHLINLFSYQYYIIVEMLILQYSWRVFVGF